MTDDGSKRPGEWVVPTEDDFWRIALDEEARGLQEEGGVGGTLEETAKAFHYFYDARAVNGVVHTTLTEVSAAVGATLASSALEVLVLSASSQWWDIKVRLSDGAVQMRFHRLGRRRGLFGSQEPEIA